MGRPRARIPLNVFLNSRLVGQLSRQTSGAIAFRYDPDWLAWEHAVPVSLSLPLRETPYRGDPVIAVFDNLLPDSEPIRRRVAERVGAAGTDSFSLLSALGRDCVGALQFLPETVASGPVGMVAGTPIDEAAIAALIRNLGTNPLGIDRDGDFRISIAGAHEKTALLLAGDRWLVPNGTAATTHILKPQIGKIGNGIDLSQSVENEFFCLTLTAKLGLPSATVRIADFEDVRALVVTRFDRRWTRDGRLLRLPQEDCCQALGVPATQKYEAEGGPGIPHILKLLLGSDEPEADADLFLKAQLVFWLLAATDGHAKNFSLFLSPGGRYRLAPLYDVLSAQPNYARNEIPRNKLKLAMAVGKSRHYGVESIHPRHFIETAAACGIGLRRASAILADIADRMPGAVDATEAALPAAFPAEIAETIIAGARKRLQVLLSHQVA